MREFGKRFGGALRKGLAPNTDVAPNEMWALELQNLKPTAHGAVSVNAITSPGEYVLSSGFAQVCGVSHVPAVYIDNCVYPFGQELLEESAWLEVFNPDLTVKATIHEPHGGYHIVPDPQVDYLWSIYLDRNHLTHNNVCLHPQQTLEIDQGWSYVNDFLFTGDGDILVSIDDGIHLADATVDWTLWSFSLFHTASGLTDTIRKLHVDDASERIFYWKTDGLGDQIIIQADYPSMGNLISTQAHAYAIDGTTGYLLQTSGDDIVLSKVNASNWAVLSSDVVDVFVCDHHSYPGVDMCVTPYGLLVASTDGSGEDENGVWGGLSIVQLYDLDSLAPLQWWQSTYSVLHSWVRCGYIPEIAPKPGRMWASGMMGG